MHYSLHSEVATIPITYRDKGIQECFFKINYWGMAKDTVDKINILAEFGLASHDPVEVNGMEVIPRQLLVTLMDSYVPPITDFLAPPKNIPPDWVKEIVTEIKGRHEGGEVIYRMGTLTVKGALPTGVAPAIAAVWLAQGRIPPGVYPPEAVLEPRDFFRELEAYDIVTRVTETRKA
jgi:saccharopine dehydrogenase-like NADP-dependent oxidoreductase